MAPGIFKLAIRSVRFYKRPVIYQILIISLLSAVITGSFLTGWSVRASLKKSALDRIGKIGTVISSGNRFFARSLASELKDSSGINCTGLLEINGFCQSLTTQKVQSNVKIYAVPVDFFSFTGTDSIKIGSGEAVINENLASSLGLRKGDEIILRFKAPTEIPADAPFAPSAKEAASIVMKIGSILTSSGPGNFSLSISQMKPQNIFINLSDLQEWQPGKDGINRLLIDKKSSVPPARARELLKTLMKPSDIGLKIIPIRKTGGYELRSERIFIDNSLLKEVQENIPGAAPLITYLGNKIMSRNRSVPYSFVAALPGSLYPETPDGNGIVINRWLADDMSLKAGDSLAMSWFAPDSLNKLTEKTGTFQVTRIVDMEGIWADSLLMPDFPGISGSESCSEWDAGVPVKIKDIRPKDEDYWKKYRGTPKAFIGYEKGKSIWGSNYGPATAIRFPSSVSYNEILSKLKGSIDPSANGFTFTDLNGDSLKAASESVDFSSLFLSLGFFLILASFVLLSFAISTYLESKHGQIRTYFSLGFKTGWIEKLILAESGFILIAGSVAGSIAGIAVNMIIIKLLNTVWQGAVQTNTLSAFISLTPVVTGFIITFVMTGIFQVIKIRLHLKHLNREKKVVHSTPSLSRNLLFLSSSVFIAALLFILSLVIKNEELNLSFASGTFLFAAMLLGVRQYLISGQKLTTGKFLGARRFSGLYYSYYPSRAVMPVLFIAAGIFTVFITGVNRMSFDDKHIKASGGTGGFLFWCEIPVSVNEDLTTLSGLRSAGFDDDTLSEMSFVPLKKYAGDDASCLNLNHVSVPPILGADPDEFIKRGSFSFAGSIGRETVTDTWQYLKIKPHDNTIYGFADQTVLDWGLMMKTGDTLIMRSESGQKLNIILAAGLKSSVFQGYVIIGMENFRKYFPSVAGSQILLVGGNRALSDLYAETINERLSNNGIKVEKTGDRLTSFFQVTNTYLSVFGVFGALGMITGIAGLGFVLLRNYNYRKREFGLMMASGFKLRKIRRLIFSEQVFILAAGLITGIISSIIATLPSLKSNEDIPWFYLTSMVIAILLTGITALLISLRSVTGSSLIASLKKE